MPLVPLLWRSKTEDVQAVKGNIGQPNELLVSWQIATLRKLELDFQDLGTTSCSGLCGFFQNPQFLLAISLGFCFADARA
jgi:hypothetical protein